MAHFPAGKCPAPGKLLRCRADGPTADGLMGPPYSWSRTTTTGQWALATQCSLTDPSSMPANSP